MCIKRGEQMKIRRAAALVDKTQTKDLGDGIIEVIVATNARDRHGEILDIKGLNTKDYSGVVLWGHDYFSVPIAKSISLRKTNDGKLISKAQFAVEEDDFAASVYKLVKGGYITDASIGFIPEQFNPETDTWTKSSMVEYSFVSIGANPEAKVTKKALDAIGLSREDFNAQAKAWFVKMKELDPDHTEGDEADLDKPEPPAPTGDDDQDIDMEPKTKQNVINHLKAITALLSATEHELNADDHQGTDSNGEAARKTLVRKRITLVRAKKTLNSVDKIVELAIGELKKQLSDN